MGYTSSLPSEVYVYIEDVYVHPNEVIAEPAISWSLDPNIDNCQKHRVLPDIHGYSIYEERRTWNVLHLFSWHAGLYETLKKHHEASGIDPHGDEAAIKFGFPRADLSPECVPYGSHRPGEPLG